MCTAHDENFRDDATIFEESSSLPNETVPDLMPDSELNTKIRSPNENRQQLFNILQSWAKQQVKNKSLSYLSIIESLHIFLTGDADCGKSFLMKVIYQALTKTLSYGNSSVHKPKVLLMASTGVAAINIDGTTIHTALNIPVGHFGKNLASLNDKIKSSLRNRLPDLKVIIIDEISMISNDLLYYVHLRLNEIFDCVTNESFAGITVIAVGDFYQLPPVGGRPVHVNYNNDWQNFESLWKLFKIFELTEDLRKRGDSQLIDFLNNVCTADIKPCDMDIIQSAITQPDQNILMKHCTFLWKM